MKVNMAMGFGKFLYESRLLPIKYLKLATTKLLLDLKSSRFAIQLDETINISKNSSVMNTYMSDTFKRKTSTKNCFFLVLCKNIRDAKTYRYSKVDEFL